MEYYTRELTRCIKEKKPVVFFKVGDGEYYCANYNRGINCDHDTYTPQKAVSIMNAISYLNETHENVHFGMWEWHPEQREFWEGLCSRPMQWVNFHTILIDDYDMDTKGETLKDKIELFKAIKSSPLKKVYVTNELLRKVKILLNVDSMVYIPARNWFETEFERILEEMKKEYDEKGTIFIFSGGLGAKPLIAELVKCYPNAIYVDIGSGLDYICTQRNTRGWRYTYSQLKDAFHELLPEDWDDTKYDELVKEAKENLGKHLPQ